MVTAHLRLMNFNNLFKLLLCQRCLPLQSLEQLRFCGRGRSVIASHTYICQDEVEKGTKKVTSEVVCFQDCVFFKQSGYAETNWHSDLRMTPFDTNNFVTVWIPLRPIKV